MTTRVEFGPLARAAVIGAGAWMVASAFDTRLEVTSQTVRSEKITKPVRLALITDLHSCYYGRGQKTLVTAVNAASPDALLYVGDICDDKLPRDNTKILLEALAGRYPSYYVSGNHEAKTRQLASIKDLFSSCGVVVLSGETSRLSVGGQVIDICGVDDPDASKYDKGSPAFAEQLERVSSVCGDGNFTLLMSHRPEMTRHYEKHSFDLIVSGHAHGGHWRSRVLNKGLFTPTQGLFPKYTSGMYRLKNSLMVVSRGLARETTMVPRICNRPELMVVTLERK